MPTVRITVESALEWRATQTESNTWIAECDSLGLVIEADSLDDLYSLSQETTSVLLADLFADNELDEFLRSHGWEAPELVSVQDRTADVNFAVPLNLIAQGDRHHGSNRRAH